MRKKLVKLSFCSGIGPNSDCSSPDAMKLFDEIIRLDLRAPFYLCWKALPLLEKTRGAIVNTSSVCALHPYTHTVSFFPYKE